ncbi:type II toxin-antitoxin system PemK/MazF family toxin [Rhodococcus erythropolis]|uniref:type II toxin-antitoxin system PemK/MazF family toxin n=1 Tax=Rhodococcus erythropolis TaxID=1833 RepID=UPI000B34A545
MRVQRGQIWIARVPYNDDPVESKRRPVLVIGFSAHSPRDDAVILVAPITSFGDGGQPKLGDVELLNWRKFGLSHGSYVRARRIWGASPAAFDQAKGALGEVNESVMSRVLTEVSALFT